MKSLQIKGLRSLIDTSAIRIAPITVLLGENSSGKSTFLRTFPLLRQSVEVKTSEPLLWFGRLVDFGSFEEALSKFDNTQTIEISIQFKLGADFAFSSKRIHFLNYDQHPSDIDCTTSLSIKKGGVNHSNGGNSSIFSSISELNISVLNTDICLKFDAPYSIESASIDGVDYSTPIKETYKVHSTNSPTPSLFSPRSLPDSDSIEEGETTRNIHTTLQEFLKSLVHGRTSLESRRELINTIILDSPQKILDQIQKTQSTNGIWKKIVNDWTIESPEFTSLKQLLWASRLEELLDAVARDLRNDFSAISYITPLRAAAERYYRQQGLAINELDSKGENFAQFLRGLTNREREELKKWLGGSLGIYVDLEESRGHVSLYLIDEQTKSRVNLADTGFGYSQLLPIAVQLWTAYGRPKTIQRLRLSQQPKTIVIEQPELHLHPRVQAKVADLLAQTIKSSENQVSIVIETHSEAIINRLGKLISAGKLPRHSVNIVLFNKPSFNSPTEVMSTEFDENGILKDWPLGFFNAD